MKSDLELYDYWPYANRPKIVWPNGARVAFWIAPNIEFYEIDPPNNPDRAPWARPHPDVGPVSIRDHGNRVAHWRLMEVLDRYKVRGSVSLSAAVCDHHPEIIKECVARNWEFFSHGIYNTRYSYGMSRDQERAMLQDSMDTILKATGQRIAGYLTPALTHTENTMDLLAELGFLYTCDLFQDDQPQPLKVKTGKLISMPYTMNINDIFCFNSFLVTPRRYCQMIKDEFDQLYEEGADSGTVMCIPLHAFLVAHEHRLAAFEEALAYITSKPGVWVTTAREIAEYYNANYYDTVVADIARRKNG